MRKAGECWWVLFLGLAGYKVLYLSLVSLAAVFGSGFDYGKADRIQRKWFSDSEHGKGRGSVERHYTTWDAEHYLYLAEFGYDKEVKSCAFFPLWPLAIRGGAILAGGSYVVAGVVLANLFSVTGWCLFYGILWRRYGGEVAWWGLCFLVLFPGSVFYQFLYSESLFFLLAMVLWRGIEERRYGGAVLAAFLLPLAKGVGVFCVVPIVWHWVVLLPERRLPAWDWLRRERKRALGWSPARSGELWFRSLLLLAPVAGWSCYLGLMWHWTGNPFEGLQAQKYWGNTHAVSHLWDVFGFAAGFFEATGWHGFRGSLLDRMGFLLLLVCLPVIWRQGKDLLAWVYMLGIVPAMSGTFTSFLRYESTVFPLFIALAASVVLFKRAWPRWFWLVAGAGLHGLLIWRFVNYRWAG